MAFCSFARDSAMFDSTPIENMFLLEHMPHLPDDCVRVYLYARMLCYHPEMGGDTAEIAKALRMEEDSVLEAFHCLEQQGLVAKMSDHPATYTFHPLNNGCALSPSEDVRKHLDYNYAILKILDVTSISSKQTRMTYDWLDVLGYSQEAALEILKYEKRVAGHFSPATIINPANKRAFDWAERGVHTLEDVERAIAYDDRVYAMADAVLKRLSITRKPTRDELDCVRRWINEWNLSQEDVLAACAHTTKARNPSIAYLDAILKEQAGGGSPQYQPLKAILQELGSAGAPTPDQLRKYAALLDKGFEPEAMLIAAVQCARKNKHRFEDLEWMLDSWDKSGVHTRAQAEKYVSDMHRATAEMRALLELTGSTRNPNLDDLNRLNAWKQKHGMDLIRFAAECARGMGKPVLYMEKLLGEWEKAEITTLEAARERHRAHRSASAGAAAQHLNYQQHSYSEEDFGEDFYLDPLKGYEPGGDKQ